MEPRSKLLAAPENLFISTLCSDMLSDDTVLMSDAKPCYNIGFVVKNYIKKKNEIRL